MASNEHHLNYDVPGSGIMESSNHIANMSAPPAGGNFHQLPRQRTTAEWEEINKKIDGLIDWMRNAKNTSSS